MEDLPLITIGIPIKNRVWCIDMVLKAIEEVEYPRAKLVFVDDYSQDGTYEIITSWAKRNKDKFYSILVVRTKSNVSKARNICINNMEGKYLLFWDSDVIPPKDLLKTMVIMMEQDSTLGIIGADYVYEPHLDIKVKPAVKREIHAVYMGFTLIRRDIFNLVGKFNEILTVGEDTEFCIRTREKTSYKILWAPKPVLHLKRKEDICKGLKKTLTWLKFNFNVRGKEYLKSFNTLPKMLRLRVVYYFFMPILLISAFIICSENMPLLVLFYLIYIMPGLYMTLRGSSSFRKGVATFFKFNIPTGIALSYGVFYWAIKSVFRHERAINFSED